VIYIYIYIYGFMWRKILLDPPFLWMDLVHERWWCLVYQFKWKGMDFCTTSKISKDFGGVLSICNGVRLFNERHKFLHDFLGMVMACRVRLLHGRDMSSSLRSICHSGSEKILNRERSGSRCWLFAEATPLVKSLLCFSVN
jgi:hypothetical protein